MKSLSRKALGIQPSATLAVDALSKKLKSEGMDIVSFGTGEPDFNTPDNIREAGIEAIRHGSIKYTPAAGLETLRQAVCDRFKKDYGLEYEYSQIVVASGAKHNVFVTMEILLDEGDEVILPAPYWVTYYESIVMAGGVPVVINTDEATNFKISIQQLEAAVTPKTKALLINNPSNPTGMLYGRTELEQIAEFCKKYDLYVISDEIYSGLVYDNREFVSFPTLSEDAKARTILITGVSKSYAMTGWRIGYTAADKQIAKTMSNYLSHSTGAPSAVSQLAAIEALRGQQETIAAMKNVFEERRNYLCGRIEKLPYVSCIKPDGAFYVFMNIKKLIGKTLSGVQIESGDDFAMALLEKCGVAVVPGRSFGVTDYVRWTYATSMENIKEGMDRLEKFLNT